VPNCTRLLHMYLLMMKYWSRAEDTIPRITRSIMNNILASRASSESRERFLSAFLYTDYTDFTKKNFLKNLCFPVWSVKSVYLRNSLLFLFCQKRVHVLEHLLPLCLGIDFSVHIACPLLHDLHHPFIFTGIEPEAVIVQGAGIEFQII
jgi:hypothetical protein